MLKTLGYSLTSILALTIASQLANLAALGLWGTLIDRFSNKAVLGIASPLFLACILGWTLTGLAWMQPMLFCFLVGLHILMGLSTAGVGLASILGGSFADYFASHQLTLAFTWKGGAENIALQVLDFHSWTFFFGIACLAGLYSLHRLSFVGEPAGTTDRLLLRHLFLEARRSVHSLSSAAGLLRAVRLPQWLMRT